MTFKEKLVILRKTKRLTQDEFASAVGVSRQAVYKWESGQSYPEVPKLLEMKLLFGITIDQLLDDTYDIPLPEKKRRRKISTEAKQEIEKNVKDSVSKNAPKVPAAPKTPAAPKNVAPKVTVAPQVEEAPVAKVEEAPVFTTVTETPAFTPVPKEPKEAPIFTPVAKVEEAPVFTPVAKESEEVVFTPVTTVAGESEDEPKEEKKSGFFGRLFGRK